MLSLRSRLRVMAAGMALAALWAAPARAQSIRITPVARDERLLVSFELEDAYSDEVRNAIQSGLQTSFTYDVELRRATSLWVDRTVAAAQVTATVRFDNLTRRYQVSILHDGRMDAPPAVTEDERTVQTAVSSFQRLPLFDTRLLEPNADYYIRVRARLRPRSNWSILPWDRDGVFGSTRFTFIPR